MATLRLDKRRVDTLKPHKCAYDVVRRVGCAPIGAISY